MSDLFSYCVVCILTRLGLKSTYFKSIMISLGDAYCLCSFMLCFVCCDLRRTLCFRLCWYVRFLFGGNITAKKAWIFEFTPFSLGWRWAQYISKIYERFCCALLCFDCSILWFTNRFMWSIRLYSSGLLHWYRDNLMMSQCQKKSSW